MTSTVNKLSSSAALVLTAMFLYGCHSQVSQPVPLTKVAFFSADSTTNSGVSYTGVVHARTESNLGFRVTGKIIQRMVDPGDAVKAGQVLMKLDANDFTLAVNAAKASVEAANARHIQASTDAQRLAKLLNSGAVSKQAYEQGKAEADSAAAQLDSARAQLRQTENQAEYAVLKADADGVIMEVPVEAGQVVTASQPVIKLARSGAREAIVNIPEQALSLVQKQATARLYINTNETFQATLRELSSTADPLTRTYQARYTLSGSASQAPLGTTVTVLMADPTVQKAIASPVGAIVDKGKGPGVWVIDKKTNVVNLRPVQIAKLGEETVLISSGLANGENVVAFGSHLLKEGQKVELLKSFKVSREL